MSDPLKRRVFVERMAALTAAALAGHPTGLDAGHAAPRRSDPPRDRFIELPTPDRPLPTNPEEFTLVEAAGALASRDLSPTELLEAYLARIGRWEPRYQAFNSLPSEPARSAALGAAPPTAETPLAGIPLAIKDNFFTAGVRTTANSFLFEDFVPNLDATAWRRLKSAGATLLGKTQMGPLATTAASTPTGEATTVNAWAPHDRSVSPGGSSSGSATAVAARMAPCSTGTQTGGSITNPSLSQGLTGIKPTMGRVSLAGILPLTYTRDHPGPIARDAVDAALMLQVMAGPDPADPRSLGLPPPADYMAAASDGRGQAMLRPDGDPIRIGVLPDFLREPEARQGSDEPSPRDRATLTARRTMLATLDELGAEIVELPFPTQWETLTSRDFNNVRLPERSEIFLEYLQRDVRGFGVSLSPWINGLLLPAAEYVRGSRARLVLLRRVLDEVFSQCDVVTQTQPFPFDMIGLPLIAFPIGFESETTGYPLPIGATLGTDPYAEDVLLGLAGAYQRATDWHLRKAADPDAFEEDDHDGEGAAGGSDRDRARRYDLFDVMERGE